MSSRNTAISNTIVELISFFRPYPRYKFVKKAGVGSQGVAACFSDLEASPDGWKKFIVKIDYRGEQRDALEEEAQMLRTLRWAKHIVTSIQLGDDPLQPSQIVNRSSKKAFLIMEYLPNGTLLEFVERYYEVTNRRLPNRILWQIFFCLARGCAAMAFPPGDPTTSPSGPLDQLLETVPLDATQNEGNNLVQQDLHEGNVMFGDIEPPTTSRTQSLRQIEHVPVPTLKLIDFGFAKELNDYENSAASTYDDDLGLGAIHQREMDRLFRAGRPEEPNPDITPDHVNRPGWKNPFAPQNTDFAHNPGMSRNIGQIGCIMIGLLIKEEVNVLNAARTWILRLTKARQNGADPNLDDDLVLLAARCVAEDPMLRPRLSQLLALLQGYIFMKTETYYANINEETDSYITRALQYFMFDA
ncbi:kinase-like domain-containing protein [Xylariaceae sp. FL0255]|nr:kinase-like domain-containing protein [Xylariaceae sp. FL0255]